MKIEFHWHSHRYFPYERELAKREVVSLFGKQPSSFSDGLSIAVTGNWRKLAQRTTYFRIVRSRDGKGVVPRQTIMEASANGWRDAREFIDSAESHLPRQVTRYSAHGLHDYRGKFNPQVVRALGNILGMDSRKWLLDPFCGSGTSLLEASHAGWNAIGLDVNPLAVALANAKVSALHIPEIVVEDSLYLLEGRLKKIVESIDCTKGFSVRSMQHVGGGMWEERLPCLDYLRAWFSDSVLAQLSRVQLEIDRLKPRKVRDIYRLILSGILREVSWQDPGDLRIRRRKDRKNNSPAIQLFLDAIRQKWSPILKARRFVDGGASLPGLQKAIHGDVRDPGALPGAMKVVGMHGRFDAAIASPPYVTALPYIDTQRLSLVFLGFLNPSQLRVTQQSLIGDREVGISERRKLTATMISGRDDLPDQCRSICMQLLNQLDESKDGFRRQNVPVLLYKYFKNMKSMFARVRHALRSGASYAMVIGENHTFIGGKLFRIDTPRYLAVLAEQEGFSVRELTPIEAYQRFDIHQANSIRSESILYLQRRG